MKRNLSITSRIALLSAAVLILLCAVIALILALTSAPTVNIESGAKVSLEGAKNGVSMLLKVTSDTDEYFAANYFPTLNGAVGDGTKDDTKALRETLNEAAKTGGTVYLPQGVYRISEPLSIPSGVTLRGDFTAPNAKQNTRTILFVSDSSALRNDSLITLQDGAALAGITVYYEKQNPSDVIPYPVTISCTGAAELCRISLLNPYQGISLSGSGRVSVRSVWMSPLDYGILIDGKTAPVDAEDLSVSPTYWLNTVPELFSSENEYRALTDYLHSHLHGVILQSVCDVTLSRISAEDAAVGILYDVPTDRDALLTASELSVSSADLPLKIQSLPKSGLTLNDSTFRPENDAGANTVELGNAVSAPVVFSNCTFGGSPKTVVRGTNPGFVSFYHCDFGTWWNACFDLTSSTFSAVSPIFRTSSDKAVFGQDAFGLLYRSPALEDSEELLFSVPEEDAETTRSDTVTSLKDTSKTVSSTVKIYDARNYGLSAEAEDNFFALSAALKAAAQTGGIVFLPEGTYHLKSTVTVPESVRLIGVGDSGSYKTELTFEVQELHEDHFMELADGSSLEHLRITQQISEEGRYFALASQSKNARISDVTVCAERGILFSEAENPSAEHISLQVSQVGIYLTETQGATLRNIRVLDSSEKTAVGVRAERSTVTLSGLYAENGGQVLSASGNAKVTGTLIRLRNPNDGIASTDGASVTLTALAAASEIPTVFLKTSNGSLTVQGALFTGSVSDGQVLSASGETAELRGTLITTRQSVSVFASNQSSVSVVGCIWESDPTYHAQATGGTVTLNGNLVLSEKEFTGIDADSAYLRVSSEGGTVTDGVNVKRYVHVESSEGGGEESGISED